MNTTGIAVGRNLKRIRVQAGDSQAECASKVAHLGLNWAQSHVSSIEGGRRRVVSLDELLVLSSVYGVALAEWFAGDDDVQVTDDLTMPTSTVREWLSGTTPSVAVVDFERVQDYSADESIARRLKMSREQVTEIATRIWGHHATIERDQRLAEKHPEITDPAKLRNHRAGMTRRLADEIELRA
ncbi:helix-turn-helix transcriptional regulator [Gordonia sp. X0973]|uniref:helix-turn-helix domain-containing protein n=1 Tax=Gordonia sp. X0973 TaxID=2742602 RepID=UPI000F51E9D4|nr:helix-turn-helix domain-containing protein [Gordonia sp. X0973]QKT06076.1 helix-turn-helix transcriptional regulator [Gordonia sp. X0973]